ncbi:MAG: hypothetical protein ACUVV6_06275, partial [Thermoplasmatota archaeon]
EVELRAAKLREAEVGLEGRAIKIKEEIAGAEIGLKRLRDEEAETSARLERLKQEEAEVEARVWRLKVEEERASGAGRPGDVVQASAGAMEERGKEGVRVGTEGTREAHELERGDVAGGPGEPGISLEGGVAGFRDHRAAMGQPQAGAGAPAPALSLPSPSIKSSDGIAGAPGPGIARPYPPEATPMPPIERATVAEERERKPVIKVRCSSCKSIIPIYTRERPLRIKCDGCGKEGTLK